VRSREKFASRTFHTSANKLPSSNLHFHTRHHLRSTFLVTSTSHTLTEFFSGTAKGEHATSPQAASIDESASIMSSSDNKAQVFKGRVVPRVKTTKHQQTMAAIKKASDEVTATVEAELLAAKDIDDST
jgi:hypothetical protein